MSPDNGHHSTVATPEELLAQVHSADVLARGSLGRQLAAHAGDGRVDRALLGLLLDAKDTFVTEETAEALLKRRDVPGLRLVAEGLAEGDEGQRNWIGDVLNDVCMQTRDDWNSTLKLLDSIREDESEAVRLGAEELRSLFVEAQSSEQAGTVVSRDRWAARQTTSLLGLIPLAALFLVGGLGVLVASRLGVSQWIGVLIGAAAGFLLSRMLLRRAFRGRA